MRKRVEERSAAVLGAVAAAVLAFAAPGAVDLELRPVDASVSVGDAVDVGLYVVSDSGSNETVGVVEAIFTWDPARLELLGITQAGAVPLLSSSLPIDPVNESNPPADGDGFYRALAQLGNRVIATPAGTLITTFQFTAVGATADMPTELGFLESLGLTQTRVFSGSVPNLVVTGDLVGTAITIRPSCPADVNQDGAVDVDDLVSVIVDWGTADHASDVTNDGTVNVDDLVEVIVNWGMCVR